MSMVRFYPYGRQMPRTHLVLLPFLASILLLKGFSLQAQTCAANSTITLTAYPNTYYPGATASLAAGSTSIALGAATYGSTPISSGDLLLVIQMQGTQIGYVNDSTYGKGVISGGRVNGYLNNASHLAGNMEYVVAANTVPVAGGTLNLLSGTVNKYQDAAYSVYGQYTYQVIRVAAYYNLILGSTITVPSWNGATGGVLVIYVTNSLNMNSQTVSAAGAGFRGGAGVKLTGGAGGSATYFRTQSANPYNGPKGEGIAGTPRFINNNYVLLDNGAAVEGYPNGSMGMGAPGNAGAGGTDGAPLANSNNSGGGGGGNGGVGGKGGNSWNSNKVTGGEPGAVFGEVSVSRLVMGGGGGAGTTNDGTGTPAGGIASSGAAGGGIVMMYAGSISGTGTIDVSGASGNGTVGNDGSGGGGAGGSVIISAASGLSGVTVKANGGTGGSNVPGVTGAHGPGGGGGAGVIYSNMTLNAASSSQGGGNGTTSTGAYGAVSVIAVSGVLIQNQVIPSPMSCSLLPAGFLSVSVSGNAGKATVSWKATNETAVLEYVVERSIDGIHFTPAGTILYQPNGNSTNDYQFTDLAPQINSPTYYRIRALDNTGRSAYSNTVSVTLTAAAGMLVISPNPASRSASLSAPSTTGGRAEIRLLDMAGQNCWHRPYTVNTGANTLLLDGLQALPTGLYLLQYNDGSSIQQVKLLIRH